MFVTLFFSLVYTYKLTYTHIICTYHLSVRKRQEREHLNRFLLNQAFYDVVVFCCVICSGHHATKIH